MQVSCGPLEFEPQHKKKNMKKDNAERGLVTRVRLFLRFFQLHLSS